MEQKNRTHIAAAPKTFTEEETIEFTGPRSELRTYLLQNYNNLYNSLFLKTINGKEQDCFNGLSAYYIQVALGGRGFRWNAVYNVKTIKQPPKFNTEV